MIPINNLSQIAASISGKINSGKKSPVFISVCGGTSTCKSTLVTSELCKTLGTEHTEIIGLDNFQKGRASKNTFVSKYRHDTPEYFEIRECEKALKKLKLSESIEVPNYSYSEGRQIGFSTISPKSFILIDGLFAAYNELQPLMDYIVYVESPLYARLIRRIVRNCYERYNAPPIITFKGFFGTLPSHTDLIVPQKKYADAIITTPYWFEESINRFQLRPLSDEVFSTTSFVFEYWIPGKTFFGIYKNGDELFFTIVHKGKKYFDFKIDEELYNKFIKLDFESV